MTSRGQGGFTLVEMMIVLAMLAMSILIAGPILRRGTSANDLGALGQRIALAARSARAEAMRRNVESALVFDSRNRCFVIMPQQVRIPLPPDVSARIDAGRELEDAGRPTIRFLPDGRSSGGDIRLATRARALHLSIDWLTGWVKRVPS